MNWRFVKSLFGDFVKMTLTGKKRDSSRVTIVSQRDWTRVTLPLRENQELRRWSYVHEKKSSGAAELCHFYGGSASLILSLCFICSCFSFNLFSTFHLLVFKA